METAVLPARDHLTEYRHHARTVPGVASPLGANPRARRKSGKTSSQVTIASMMSDASWYLSGDISVGVLRGLAASATGSPARLMHAASSSSPPSSPFSSSSSSSRLSSSHGMSATFFGSSQSALSGGQFNGARIFRSGVLPKPAAVLERVHGKKVLDRRGSEAAVLDRTSDKKPLERGRGSLDKRPAKGISDCSASDRRPDVLDRRPPDRRVPERERGSVSADIFKGRQDSERSTSSSRQRSVTLAAPVITILKRPQTKEAAAENLAIITGVPLSEIYKNGLPAPPPAALAEAAAAKDVPSSKGLLTANDTRSSVVNAAEHGDGQSSTHRGPTLAFEASTVKKASLLHRKSKGEAAAKDVPSSKSLPTAGETGSSFEHAAEQGDGQSSTHGGPTVALDASTAKTVSLLHRKSKGEVVAKDVPPARSLVLTGDGTRSSVADAAEERDGKAATQQGPAVASESSAAMKVNLLHPRSQIEAVAKGVPLHRGLVTADEPKSSLADAAEEGDGQSSVQKGSTVTVDASTARKVSLVLRKSKVEAATKDVLLFKGLLTVPETRSSVGDASEGSDWQSSTYEGPTVAVDASTSKKASLTYRKSKGEALQKGVTTPSKNSDVPQVEDVSGDKFDGQRSSRASSSRERRSDNAQQRPVRPKSREGKRGSVDADQHVRRGDSPVKDLVPSITKVREKSGSPRGRSVVVHPVVVSPGSISSVPGYPLKSSSGNFGFLDSLSDILFLGPRSPANERWAGPAYSNSPPPSSLPMPKFSLHKIRDSAASDLDVVSSESDSSSESSDELSEESSAGEGSFQEFSSVGGSSSAPSSPSRTSSGSGAVLQIGPDVSSVARDLRRLLNMDVSGSRVVDGLEKFEETLATERLKRILQLG